MADLVIVTETTVQVLVGMGVVFFYNIILFDAIKCKGGEVGIKLGTDGHAKLVHSINQIGATP